MNGRGTKLGIRISIASEDASMANLVNAKTEDVAQVIGETEKFSDDVVDSIASDASISGSNLNDIMEGLI